ncbi:serine/threonine dehydratase [Marinicella sp. W31]|uniref:serine/threonine dehydratase n=1 Tax=Marinicella sp. W31 TaxID=3023713 RepID=UPI003756DD5A
MNTIVPPQFTDIQQAWQRIRPHISTTPIVESQLLNQWLGHRILFKAECMQKIGAFKARGACNAIMRLVENDAKPSRIVANSSGNHAQAVAWAAAQFNIPATIYMPANVSQVKAQATASYGAEVVLCEDRFSVDEQVEMAAKTEGTLWIPPYNHIDVICGQGTATLEALHQLDEVPDAVFGPCGGGGLLSGTLIAAKGVNPAIQVVGVEPLNANDAAESIRSGSIQKLSKPADTIADGVRTPSIGALTFPQIKQLDDFFEVEEEAIIYWTQWLQHLLKLHMEPTCAMTMEGVSQWLKQQQQTKTVLVIVTGGNIDQPTMRQIWQHNCLDITPEKRFNTTPC